MAASARKWSEGLINPVGYFNSLKARPRVIVPFLVLLAIYIIFYVTTVNAVIQADLERFAARGIDISRLRSEGAHPEIVLGISSFVTDCLGRLINPLPVALAAWGLANLAYQGIRFRTVLAIILPGEILYGAGQLLKAGIIVLKNNPNVSFSPAVIASIIGLDSLSRLYLILARFDFFLIGEIILVGIGLSTVLGCPRRRGYILAGLSVGFMPASRLILLLLS